MTADLVAEIEKLIEKIEQQGGAVAAIEQGFQKSQIEDSAFAIAQEIEKKTRKVVGVNEFTQGDDSQPVLHKLDPRVGEEQRARLAAFKARRDNELVSTLLKKISDVAHSTENVMPHIKSAIKSGATVGEICDALRSVWGVYRSREAF